MIVTRRRRFPVVPCSAVWAPRSRCPLLDGMVPALSAIAQHRRRGPVPGSGSCTCRTARSWTGGRRPIEGPGFELTPILEPLAAHRDRLPGPVEPGPCSRRLSSPAIPLADTDASPARS